MTESLESKETEVSDLKIAIAAQKEEIEQARHQFQSEIEQKQAQRIMESGDFLKITKMTQLIL